LHQFDTKEKWVDEILDSLLENNIHVIPVFNYNLQEFSHKKRALLIDNFVHNSDINHVYLFLKYSKFVITNDESLKIACGLTKKPHLYYNFNDKELILQDVIKDINLLIN
jgi:predicted glutamine amidotransferase